MEEQIITLINQRIANLFEEVKNILLQQDNYQQEVDTKNITLYFNFIEASLQLPYNRLTSTAAFTANYDGLLSCQMYPFAMLKEGTKQIINDKYKLAVNYAAGLDLSGIDVGFTSLCREEHMKELGQCN